MTSKPMVFPVDGTGTLYVLQDEHGREVGVGSRETCYTLLHLFFRPAPAKPRAYEPFKREPYAAPVAMAEYCASPLRPA
jgi:hypothetical protein